MHLFTYVLHLFKLFEAYRRYNVNMNCEEWLLKLIRIEASANMAKIPHFGPIWGFQNFQKPIFLSLLVSLTPKFVSELQNYFCSSKKNFGVVRQKIWIL